MQHLLLVIIENCKKALDKGENVCTIFIDLWKSFDTINHDLLLAKLKAHGFTEMMCSYLKDRQQAFQISNSFSSYKQVKEQQSCISVFVAYLTIPSSN